MSRLAFYRLAIPAWLDLCRLRAIVWVLWTMRVVRGLFLGRWPWEVIRDIRDDQRRIRAASDRMFREIEKAVLGRSGGSDRGSR